MNMEVFLQYVTYVLMAIGALAFIVSVITQVIKEMPHIKNIQTNAVAMVVSLVICPVTVIMACQYFKIVIVVFASFIAAFIVYLVSTGGWERVSEMWNRTKYNKK